MKKVVQFSGGKDSIVCLHLFKDEKGKICRPGIEGVRLKGWRP
jgi:tRNA(Ile)-lysidine synthase TilS/MesJ